MATSNPIFRNSPAFSASATKAAQLNTGLSADQLEDLYRSPSADADATGRMSYEDTLVKIALCFGVLLIGAAIGWMVVPQLWLPAMIVGLVLGLVNAFKKTPSPALILSYAGVEGVFLGGISLVFSRFWDGIVPQAIFGTLAVVAIVLALFSSGKIRATKKMTQIVLVAVLGYAAFSVVNLILMWTGVTQGMFGLRSADIFGIPLGLIIGVLAIFLAAYCLVLDFTTIKTGVERGAPRVYAWSAAFGVLVTVIWLYIEILRLLAIARE